MATGRYARDREGRAPLTLAVEGVIGVGKTTLAKALAERMGAVRLDEEDLRNPFLEQFYRNRARWGLACQLFFLEARLRQFARNLPVGVPVVSDHSLIKEPIFARCNLEGEELALHGRLFGRLAPTCRFHPRVVVYLSASLPEVRERIRARGRRSEGAIDVAYLSALVDSYAAWLAGEDAGRQRVVVVSADGNNIAGDHAAVDRLLDACMAAPMGLSYCNPL